MPTSVRQRATSSGPRSSGRPNSSSRSAAPQADDAARLPCFTTRTPAAATAMAAIVEMLTVWARSPPVPTMSTAVSRTASGSWTRVALASIASAKPAISAGDSPLARSAITNPAVCTGVALPAMISPIAQAVSAVDSSSPCSSAVNRLGQVRSAIDALRASAGESRAVAEQRGHGLSGQDRVERVHQGRLDPGVGGEPPVGRPRDDDAARRRIGVLVLELPGDAEAAAGARLAVQDQQVDVLVVDDPYGLGVGRGVHETYGQVLRRPGPDSEPHPVADLRVVAVEQNRVAALGHDRPTPWVSRLPWGSYSPGRSRDCPGSGSGASPRAASSSRSSCRSMRRFSRSACRIHCTTSTPSIVTL